MAMAENGFGGGANGIVNCSDNGVEDLARFAAARGGDGASGGEGEDDYG